MSEKIAAALHSVMSKVGYVQKLGENKFHNYKYAGEGDLLKVLRPAMIEAGLMLIPSIQSVTATDENGNTNVLISYTLVHKDGDVWPEKIMAAGCGGDKNKGGVGDKGLYKALTGANKYLLFKLFQIETGDDPENNAKQQADVEQAQLTYIEAAKAAISLQETSTDLDAWWTAEKDNRKKVGIIVNSDFYLTLANHFKDRKVVLLQKENTNG